MALRRRALLRAAAVLASGMALHGAAPAAMAAEVAGAGSAGGGAPESDAERLSRRLGVCRPPEDPLQELLRRNRSFQKAWQAAERSEDPLQRALLLQNSDPVHCQVRPDALAEGQKPWASLLCCADSRVAPEWIFASGSGELFQVRSAGNTAFDAGIASLEYAVLELAVPLILVMGHSGCGAVKAAMGRGPLTPLLEDLVTPIRATLRPGDDLNRAVRANAAAVAAALPRRSATLAEAIAAGRLKIQPAFFDIGSGAVSLV